MNVCCSIYFHPDHKMLYNIYNISNLCDKYDIYNIYNICMLYNSHVVICLLLSKFRSEIRAIVRKAEDGEPTVVTVYRADDAAIAPMDMFASPVEKVAAYAIIWKSEKRGSYPC